MNTTHNQTYNQFTKEEAHLELFILVALVMGVVSLILLVLSCHKPSFFQGQEVDPETQVVPRAYKIGGLA